MKKIFFSLFVIIFLGACNNSGNRTSTADSLNRAPSIDTMKAGDTASYERNNVTGTDSTQK
jgi:hypothetical protein